jgi:hypothetical protein
MGSDEPVSLGSHSSLISEGKYKSRQKDPVAQGWIDRQTLSPFSCLPWKHGCQMVSFQTKKIPIWVNFGGP